MPVYPLLSYRDADAALQWLERVFGFTATEVHRDGTGAVAHAEIRVGDGLVMIGGGRPEHAGRGWLYVGLPDVDALHARAREAGADVSDLVDQDYGSRDFQVQDLEGNQWSFGTYAPE
jgi:uncharacterized glyoxalase superfamily protein PhnB